ncbi:MAG: hypothetical protein GX610_24270 [Rhodococcus sp.]|nr:hypothetical protein [Rhodococcus sp. (in: high G+C Gram-positive bacteria)]
MCTAIAIAAACSTAGYAAAAPTTIPFQVTPTPYGNPNGSVDFPPTRCVAIVGAEAGSAQITGGKEDGWGCPTMGAPWTVLWLNLSTGAAGSAVLVNDSYERAPETTIDTGAGQVAVFVHTNDGIHTPGLATFYVP